MVLFFVKTLCVFIGIVLACSATIIGALAIAIAFYIRIFLVLAAMLSCGMKRAA